MTDFIYWLFDALYAFVDVFKKLGNVPNYIFIVLSFVGLFYWLNKQKKYNKEAQENGTLK